MVTAELAVAIPALLVVLAVALAAVRAGVDEVRCVDAAHVAARLLARGEADVAARAAAGSRAPAGARVSVEVADSSVRVGVGCPRPSLLRALGVPDGAPAVATARLEPGAPAAGP